MDIDVVKCLLSSGVEINLRDKYGQSPLYERESTIYIYREWVWSNSLGRWT